MLEFGDGKVAYAQSIRSEIFEISHQIPFDSTSHDKMSDKHSTGSVVVIGFVDGNVFLMRQLLQVSTFFVLM